MTIEAQGNTIWVRCSGMLGDVLSIEPDGENPAAFLITGYRPNEQDPVQLLIPAAELLGLSRMLEYHARKAMGAGE